MDIDDSQFSLKISDCIMFDKETQVTIYNEDSMKLFQRGLRQISKYIKFYSGSSIGLLGYGHSQNFDAAQEAKLIGKLDLRKHTIMFGLNIGGTKLILMEAVKTGTLITGLFNNF